MAFLTSVQDLFASTANQNNWNTFKNPMSREPFVSRAKVPTVKRSEKGYGNENVEMEEREIVHSLQ